MINIFKQQKLPWEGRGALFEYVKFYLTTLEFNIENDDFILPDNAPVRASYGLYNPGADDYFDYFDRHKKDINPKFIKRLVDLFIQYGETKEIKYKIKFYNMVKDNPVIFYWDKFLDELTNREYQIEPSSVELCEWMVCEAPDREVVKLGIVLMGILREPDYLGILTTIGSHDEFTYFVAEALQEMTPVWDVILMNIVKSLNNFGRAIGMHFLIYDSDNKEVLRWCYCHGFKKFYANYLILQDIIEEGRFINVMREEEWDSQFSIAVQVVLKNIVFKSKSFTSNDGKILHMYVKRTVGKKKGMVQYALLNRMVDLFEKIKEDNSIIAKMGLTEEEYSDIWIDVQKEVKKNWYKTLDDPKNYDATGRRMKDRSFNILSRLDLG